MRSNFTFLMQLKKNVGLLAILFVLLLPVSGFGQNGKIKSVASATALKVNQNQVATENSATPLEQFKNRKEDLTKRDAFSKHYKNADGSYTALIGSGQIHYKKDGVYQDINYAITNKSDANFPVANTTNLFESHFGATSQIGIKNHSAEGELHEFTNKKMYWEVNGQATNAIAGANVPVAVHGHKAYYNNLYGNISAEFTIESGKRKLNYIIPSAGSLGNIPAGADYLTFSEDISLPLGWTYSFDERKGILIKNNSGNIIYNYDNPVSTDASENLENDNTKFAIVPHGNGNTLTVLTKIKTSWLLDSSRQFPVKVDPTVSYFPNASTHRTAQLLASGSGAYGTIAVGYNGGFYRSYASFNIAGIPDSATINSVTLNHNVGSTTGMTSGSFGSEIRSFLTDPESATYTTWLSVYNAVVSASNSPTLYTTVTNLNSTGWKSAVLGTTANANLTSALTSNKFTIGYRPAGSYTTTPARVAQIYGETDAGGLGRVVYISVAYTESAACSGTPVGGTASLSSNTGNLSSTFTASVTGDTSASGLSYQWESGPSATGPWTNVTGATAASNTITAANTSTVTYYRRKITCGAASSYSTVVSYTTLCIPTSTNGNCAAVGDCGYVGISRVLLGTIDNTTGFANVSPAYSNYTNLSTNVSETNNYSLQVTIRDLGGNAANVAAWIDWNGDSIFSGASEYLGTSTNVVNNQVATFTFSVPSGTSLGAKRMRIRSVYNDQTLLVGDGCTTKEYGETEDYTVTILAPPNPTLTVANAGTGASHPNGTTAITYGTSLTLTAGTVSGFVCSGWTGTGSVPATGSANTVTFTITQNSSINWTYVAANVTGTPLFYNSGGSEQLTFNNSRLNDDTPTFRLSHSLNSANRYQIQVSANSAFTTPLEQTYSGTYAIGTQANFNFTASAGQLVNGTTYYVRARTSGDGGGLYSSWSTETYSFTYDTANTLPYWFQTTQEQLATATHSGTQANSSGNIVATTGSGTNPILNPSFEGNVTNWSSTSSFATTFKNVSSTEFSTVGSSSLKMYNISPDVYGYQSGDYITTYQTVNLTGVANISMDLKYVGQGTIIAQFRAVVSDTGQASGITGTQIGSWTPTSNSATTSLNIDISGYGFTGSKVIKLIYYITAGEAGTFNQKNLYVDNVVATSAPTGTATSTPILLASVLGASKYNAVQWTQTLNGGTASLKIQQYNGTTWEDVSGYTNITATGDGLKSFSLSSMTAYSQIRVAATLSGNASVALNDWSITTALPCTATITSVSNPIAICSGATTNLSAVANNPAHTIRWYSSATGETILGTGTSFTTATLATTTTFYAAAYNGTCESERLSVVVTVTPIVTALNKAIGSPANGTSHTIALSWNAVAGITNYVLESSEDNATWIAATTTTGTSYTFNAGDNPDKQYFFRIKSQAGNCYTESGSIYTAADAPGALVLNNPSGTTMQISIPAETPVVNPAQTTYAVMGEASGLYVQADGSLGVTAVYRTKAAWGTITVTGLTPLTQYCFIAKAKNQDGDVRFTQATTVAALQEFNSNVLTTASSTTVWYTANSQPAFAWTSTGGCSGGKIGYSASFNNFWGNFVRMPEFNATGMNEVKLKLDLSNSYFAGRVNSYVNFYIWADGAYKNVVSAVKVNGVSITSDNQGKILFDAARTCAPVEITMNLATVTNKSNILLYLSAASGYNNSDAFSFSMDNITIIDNGATPVSVCLSTTSACTAAITGVTNGSGCSTVLLQATGSASTTSFNWYAAASGGTAIATTPTGQWTTPVITANTTYYVSSSNGTCESPRIAVTATYEPSPAAILSTTGGSLCGAGSVTIYAETTDDGTYTVNWYTAATGGSPIHTGFDYTVSPTQTTSYYVAAVDGSCESARTQVTVVIASKTWNGSAADQNWNNAANWTPSGVPNATNCVVIPLVSSLPVITGTQDGYAKSLTLTGNATLFVQTGGSITVVNDVIVDPTATMTLDYDAYLVQTQPTTQNTNQGVITVNKRSTPMFRLEATAWSSPVQQQKLYDFALGTVFGRIYYYDEPSNAFLNTGITTESPFVPGKGYSVRAPNTFPNYSATNTPTPVAFQNFFLGKPNNGDIGIGITNQGLGFNYVGNPYPSPIDAQAFLGENENIEAMYFWTHEAPPVNGAYAANNYATYTSGGGVPSAAGGLRPDGVIQTGQGFVVKTTESYLLQFTNDMRVNSSNGQFFRQPSITEKHRMWLNLSDSAINYNQILVGYMSNATMGADHQIDAKLFGYSGNAIYSLIEDQKYVIQGRSLPFETTDVVPLGFRADRSGAFTISIDNTDGLFAAGQTIFLKDLATNTVHNLSEGAYEFITEPGTYNDRFQIVYENLLTTSNPNSLTNNWTAFKNEDSIKVQSRGFDIESVEVYDITGRLLLKKDNINSQEFTAPVNFAQQVLLVKVNKTLAKKVL